MKTLWIGMLIVSPALVYWAGRIDRPPVTQPVNRSFSTTVAPGSTVSIPVEVIENGSAPKWIYVQVGN